jgi:hypothetical protein
MSASQCNELGLAYDPSIRLNMQLANGNCNLSLGLVHNVPFLIFSLTFYLQVHIVQSPAYDVLLGQPFNILTQSIIQNLPMKTKPLPFMIQIQAGKLQSPQFQGQPDALPECTPLGNRIFNSRRVN